MVWPVAITLVVDTPSLAQTLSPTSVSAGTCSRPTLLLTTFARSAVPLQGNQVSVWCWHVMRELCAAPAVLRHACARSRVHVCARGAGRRSDGSTRSPSAATYISVHCGCFGDLRRCELGSADAESVAAQQTEPSAACCCGKLQRCGSSRARRAVRVDALDDASAGSCTLLQSPHGPPASATDVPAARRRHVSPGRHTAALEHKPATHSLVHSLQLAAVADGRLPAVARLLSAG